MPRDTAAARDEPSRTRALPLLWTRFVRTIALACGLLAAAPAFGSERTARPNVLWISAEDLSPDLGCYGDAQARTPHLDQLARDGARFSNAFSVYGVCAPSRSAIITGMYPATIGTHHMRSKGVPPSYVKCFTEYLRAAGYFCTNNSKTDYNFDPPITAWDENGNKAHWRHRDPAQPFFAVFNITTTHESKIRCSDEEFAKLTRRLRPADRHDPAHAALPPYYPDTPETRNDWTRYYDLVTAMDLEVHDLLEQLKADGLAQNTVVFFWGDHGRGLPRAKRWAYEASIHVPLIVRWPGVIEPGTVRDPLVSLMDLAPTVLSIAGVKPPAHMQAQAFLGDHAAPPRRYVFAARDRMDETYDMIRAVRDHRFHYLKNYQPAKPYAQYIDYMDEMPTMKVMRKLNKQGTLTGAQRLFFLPEKPAEELYDTPNDPHQIHNLAGAPEFQDVLLRMRDLHTQFMNETNDLGLVPEPELQERMRPGGVWASTAKPTIEPPGGSFAKPLRVRIDCGTDGASIAFTTQPGPNARWKLYTGELQLDQSATLRVKACRLGYRDSEEVTAAYEFESRESPILIRGPR